MFLRKAEVFLPHAAALRLAGWLETSTTRRPVLIWRLTDKGRTISFINRTLSGNFGYRFSETNQSAPDTAQQHQQCGHSRANDI